MNETEQREAAQAALALLEQQYPQHHARFVENAREEGFDDPVAAMMEVAKLASWVKAEATAQ